jgi:hypothetical protein
MKRFPLFCLLLGTLPVLGQDFTKPETTEVWEPKPPIVTKVGPVTTPPPADALVLFDGRNLNAWTDKNGKPSGWTVQDGVATIVPKNGDLVSKQAFGDCQLHLEFRLPPDAKTKGTDAGNSGVFLQERYEIQIFDSYQYEVPLYYNGMAGAVYKQSVPLANAMTAPGTWNSYDIYYTAPRFRKNGSLETPAYVTVVHNGVLVLNHFQIHGTIRYIGIPTYERHGKAPLVLQGHGSPVSFRNIWIREL